MLGCPQTRVPVATWVVGELTIFGIPVKGYLIVVAIGLLASVVVGSFTGEGANVVTLLGSVPPLMFMLRRAYQRDRHILAVWRVMIFARFSRIPIPFHPGWRSRGLAGDGNRIVS